MSDYVEKLKGDLAEQFKEKPNIRYLVEAVGNQLTEIHTFFEKLRTQRSVKNAVGKQLDLIGEIVCLSRSEIEFAESVSDETYRSRIMFKVLKNTSDCTYDDIRNAIEMLWTGPKLKFVEDPYHSATLVFEFDASEKWIEENADVPFIKAGGVGLLVRMKSKDEFTIYYGMPIQRAIKTKAECQTPIFEAEDYFIDELGFILTNEVGDWLI